MLKTACDRCGREPRFGEYFQGGLCWRCTDQLIKERQEESDSQIPSGEEVEFHVVMGGSGRWIARRLTSKDADHPMTGKPIFTGHVPRRVENKGEIITRQIARKWRNREYAGYADLNAAPNGGSAFNITVKKP